MEDDIRSRYRSAAPKPEIRFKPNMPANHTPQDHAHQHPKEPDSLQRIRFDSPAAKHNKRRRLPINKKLVISLFGLIVLSLGAFFGYNDLHKANDQHYFPSSINSQNMKIAVYYPVRLPQGFQVDNDFKVLQTNILNYSVTPPSGTKIYLTIQAIPNNFDFNGFKAKFSKPDEYSTTIGDSLVGQVGASVVGSIRTNQNSWVILNSSNLNSINEMEAITRSLQQVQL